MAVQPVHATLSVYLQIRPLLASWEHRHVHFLLIAISEGAVKEKIPVSQIYSAPTARPLSKNGLNDQYCRDLFVPDPVCSMSVLQLKSGKVLFVTTDALCVSCMCLHCTTTAMPSSPQLKKKSLSFTLQRHHAATFQDELAI